MKIHVFYGDGEVSSSGLGTCRFRNFSFLGTVSVSTPVLGWALKEDPSFAMERVLQFDGLRLLPYPYEVGHRVSCVPEV
jgi:hypothetical protein